MYCTTRNLDRKQVVVVLLLKPGSYIIFIIRFLFCKYAHCIIKVIVISYFIIGELFNSQIMLLCIAKEVLFKQTIFNNTSIRKKIWNFKFDQGS